MFCVTLGNDSKERRQKREFPERGERNVVWNAKKKRFNGDIQQI